MTFGPPDEDRLRGGTPYMDLGETARLNCIKKELKLLRVDHSCRLTVTLKALDPHIKTSSEAFIEFS